MNFRRAVKFFGKAAIGLFVPIGLLLGYIYFSSIKPLQERLGMFSSSGSERLSPEPVHFVLAGQDFWIPKYFLLPPYETYVEPSLIGVYAGWPDFSPRIEERKDRKLAQKNIKQSVTVVLDNKRKTPLNGGSVLEARRAISDKVYGPFAETGETVFGLKKYVTTRFQKAGMYGEMYEEHRDGKLVSYILCSPGTRNPTCASHQETEHFIVRVRFNMIYLSEWKQAQARGAALIESFRKQTE